MAEGERQGLDSRSDDAGVAWQVRRADIFPRLEEEKDVKINVSSILDCLFWIILIESYQCHCSPNEKFYIPCTTSFRQCIATIVSFSACFRAQGGIIKKKILFIIKCNDITSHQWKIRQLTNQLRAANICVAESRNV